MAEIIAQSGESVDIGAALPQLTGEFLPAIDKWSFVGGLGMKVPWGAGSTIRESMMSNPESLFAEVKIPETQQMMALVNSILPAGITNYNYYFEGLIGPQGIPGPPGPQGIGITNYVGGAGTPSSALASDVPETSGIVFTQSGSNVIWTAGTLRYKGVVYSITAEATGDINKYIYWDKDDVNTTFKTTNTLATAMGADKWIMCYNDGGVPYVASANKVLHAGILEASTIDTIHLNAQSVTTAKINDEDVTTGKLINEATRIRESAYTAGSIQLTTSDADMVTDSITSVGGAIQITGTTLFTNNTYADFTTPRVRLSLYRDTTLLINGLMVLNPYQIPGSHTITYVDTPGAGTYTYKLKAKDNKGSGQYASLRTIILDEGKGK